jgi:hypothetical protein
MDKCFTGNENADQEKYLAKITSKLELTFRNAKTEACIDYVAENNKYHFYVKFDPISQNYEDFWEFLTNIAAGLKFASWQFVATGTSQTCVVFEGDERIFEDQIIEDILIKHV